MWTCAVFSERNGAAGRAVGSDGIERRRQNDSNELSDFPERSERDGDRHKSHQWHAHQPDGTHGRIRVRPTARPVHRHAHRPGTLDFPGSYLWIRNTSDALERLPHLFPLGLKYINIYLCSSIVLCRFNTKFNRRYVFIVNNELLFHARSRSIAKWTRNLCSDGTFRNPIFAQKNNDFRFFSHLFLDKNITTSVEIFVKCVLCACM